MEEKINEIVQKGEMDKIITRITDEGYEAENSKSPDYAKAFDLYAAAAALGGGTAWNSLGWLLLNVYGSEKDIRDARECFKESIRIENNALAMVNLGNTYDPNFDYGGKNAKKAFEWYKRAADAGNEKGKYNLVNCYHYGHGVKKSHKKAYKIFKWLYRKRPGTDGAAFYMGLYHEKGFAVKKDYKKAMKYYQVGAMEGDGYSYLHIGCMYAKGKGVKKNFKKAMEHYRKALEHGDDLAYANIGWMYEKGDGVKKDFTKAVEYYREGAYKGEEHCIKALKRLDVPLV